MSGNTINKPGVNTDGKLTLPACVGALNATPQPLFAKNIVDFGADVALEISEAEEGDPEPHDFGTCFVRKGSLRELVAGEWFVDLAVENPRECSYQRILVDGDGDLILDGEDNVQSKTSRYNERFVTVPLGTVDWMPDHPDTKHKGETVQYCQRRNKRATAADTVAASLAAQSGSNKAKGVRLAPAKMAALLASISG